MENKNQVKKINIKNHKIKWKLRIFILVIFYEMKYHTKIFLIYYISYKTFMSEKPLHILFVKIDGFIKIDNGIRYLAKGS